MVSGLGNLHASHDDWAISSCFGPSSEPSSYLAALPSAPSCGDSFEPCCDKMAQTGKGRSDEVLPQEISFVTSGDRHGRCWGDRIHPPLLGFAAGNCVDKSKTRGGTLRAACSSPWYASETGVATGAQTNNRALTL
jgi:hypothetical protein